MRALTRDRHTNTKASATTINKKKRTKRKQLKTIVLSPNVNDYDTGEYAPSDNTHLETNQ
jgi:hypothetical protein